MNKIRSWLYIGKYRDTRDQYLLKMHNIEAMLQLAELVEQPNIVSQYLAVEDGEPLPEEMLRRGVDFIKEHQKADRKILVACGAGISRSASYAIAAIKEVENTGMLEAYNEVRLHHSQAMPHPALWASLCEYYDEDISFSELMR